MNTKIQYKFTKVNEVKTGVVMARSCKLTPKYNRVLGKYCFGLP